MGTALAARLGLGLLLLALLLPTQQHKSNGDKALAKWPRFTVLENGRGVTEILGQRLRREDFNGYRDTVTKTSQSYPREEENEEEVTSWCSQFSSAKRLSSALVSSPFKRPLVTQQFLMPQFLHHRCSAVPQLRQECTPPAGFFPVVYFHVEGQQNRELTGSLVFQSSFVFSFQEQHTGGIKVLQPKVQHSERDLIEYLMTEKNGIVSPPVSHKWHPS
ncbi:hypothetical protein BTVI_91997 [Pitangus sulphuratus]|nr:hypothetical protein BTVI_91997 [Pitangus sulphuratus]